MGKCKRSLLLESFVFCDDQLSWKFQVSQALRLFLHSFQSETAGYEGHLATPYTSQYQHLKLVKESPLALSQPRAQAF